LLKDHQLHGQPDIPNSFLKDHYAHGADDQPDVDVALGVTHQIASEMQISYYTA